MQCSQCSKRMRGFGVSKDDAPDTVAQGGRGLCSNCVKRQGKPAADPVDDNPAVLVRSILRPSTYRVFAHHAKELGIEVGELLSRIADRAVKPEAVPAPIRPRKQRAPRAEDAIDARIRHLNSAGLNDTEIAKQIGMSQPNTSQRRRRLGLLSPTPKGGRRKAV